MNYCVYKHTCPNSKVYIGITGQNPVKRWNNGQGYERHKYFYNAILKYGWDNIKHEILYSDLSKDEACEKEIELIAQYKSNNSDYGYNLSSGGESGSKGSHWSEESKKKHSEKISGENHWAYGKHLSEKHRQRISETHVGMQGKHHSEETKRKMSESKKGKFRGANSPLAKKIINLDTGEIFESMGDAKNKYNICDAGITRCCKGIYSQSGGFHWAYFDEVMKT